MSKVSNSFFANWAYTVKLYKSFDDANFKTNPIDLTAYGPGNHTVKSKVILSFLVNPAFGCAVKVTFFLGNYFKI